MVIQWFQQSISSSHRLLVEVERMNEKKKFATIEKSVSNQGSKYHPFRGSICLSNLVHWKEFFLAVSAIYFIDTLGEPNASHSTNFNLPLKRNFSNFAKGIQSWEPFSFLQYGACPCGNNISNRKKVNFISSEDKKLQLKKIAKTQPLLQVPYPEK